MQNRRNKLHWDWYKDTLEDRHEHGNETEWRGDVHLSAKKARAEHLLRQTVGAARQHPHGTDYFGGARSKGFATLRNVSKLQFFDKTGQAKSVGFRFYSAI